MWIFHKGELKVLWPFYAESFCAYLIHFAPAFMVLYFSKLGFSFAQLGLLLAIIPITSILFEIPTGAIADLYGRKFSVLLGYLFEGLGYLALFFVTDFSLIFLVYVVIGVATTLSSGSKEAWVIDLLKKKDRGLIHNYFSNTQIIESLSLVLSGIIGAFVVASLGLSVIWVFAFLSFVLSILILLFAKEVFKKQELHSVHIEVFKQAKKAARYAHGHNVLFYYLGATFLLAFAATFSSGLTWTPLLKGLSFPDYGFGLMWSAVSFVIMIAPFFSKKFLKPNKEKRFMIIALSASSVFALLVLFANSWLFALACILLLELFVEMRTPASRVYFHRFVPNKLRATLGSLKAMLVSIASAASLIVGGYIIDLIGPKYSLVVFVPTVLVAILFLIKMKEKSV